MKNITHIVRRLLYHLGIELSLLQKHHGRITPMRPWDEDPEFAERWELVARHTLLDRQRGYVLYQILKGVSSKPGAWAEVGVYQGGTALLAAHLKSRDCHLYLFDTFQGMPATDPSRDQHRSGDFSQSSLERVQSLVKPFENVTLKKGVFPDSAAGLEEERFSFVHIDADIYQSVLDSCEWFYPRLLPGGVMIFDDYGFVSCPGALQAVDEYCAARGLAKLYLGTGQALIWKQ